MKFIRNKSVIPLIGMAVLISISICVAFLYKSPEGQECFYNITVEKSVYRFPWWNITILAQDDIPKIFGVQLRYGEQWLEKHEIGASLEEGDRLTLHFNFNVHVVSGENFTLYLYFHTLGTIDKHSGNYFMRINLTLPVGGDLNET